MVCKEDTRIYTGSGGTSLHLVAGSLCYLHLQRRSSPSRRVGRLPQLLSDIGRYRPWTRLRWCSPATSSRYVFAPPKILGKLRHCHLSL
jgi:hypothetical protein